jgi:hypothetical protein
MQQHVPILIYCASKNRRFDDIAVAAGFKIGAQVPCTVYHDLYFCDQNWKAPDRERYMVALEEHKPTMASVIDWERAEQLSDVLSWAEEAAQYVKEWVMIIPKVASWENPIGRLPRRIGGKSVVLGYSVPTSHGGTDVPLYQFSGWPIHLLGGSPHAQMWYARRFRPIADVVSVDGNMTNKLATRRGQFWENGTAHYARDRYWPKLSEAGWTGKDAPLEAFRRSCENIAGAWGAAGC